MLNGNNHSHFEFVMITVSILYPLIEIYDISDNYRIQNVKRIAGNSYHIQ